MPVSMIPGSTITQRIRASNARSSLRHAKKVSPARFVVEYTERPPLTRCAAADEMNTTVTARPEPVPSGASLGGASLGGASLGGASLGGASLGGASLGGGSLGKRAFVISIGAVRLTATAVAIAPGSRVPTGPYGSNRAALCTSTTSALPARNSSSSLALGRVVGSARAVSLSPDRPGPALSAPRLSSGKLPPSDNNPP